MGLMEKEKDHSANNSLTSPAFRTGVLAIGNFDGVHKGHQAVIKTAIHYAHEHNSPAYALTFEPHPRQLLYPQNPPFRLTSPSTKIRLIKELGVDDTITLPFSPELAQASAEDFALRILKEQCQAKHIVAGFNFVFSRERSGNLQTLRSLLNPAGIEVTEVSPQVDDRGEIISSSSTRAALRKGDTEMARRMLGRYWSIRGLVQPGDRRGNALGFPTANIALGEYLRPLFGVYAVMARPILGETLIPGVINIGKRPTVGGANEMLELHLLEPQGELYGQEWEVELHHFIRPEQAFPSLEALKSQIAIDTQIAKKMLSAA